MREETELLSWRSRVMLLLGRGFLQVLARTWRIRVVNAGYLLDLRRAERPSYSRCGTGTCSHCSGTTASRA